MAGLIIKLSFVSAQRAFERQPWACIAGLISGWTALFVAIWVAMLCAVLGAIGGFFTIGFLSFGIGQASQGLDLAGAAAGFWAGFLDGFLWIFGGSLAAAPDHVLLSLAVGAVARSASDHLLHTFRARHPRLPQLPAAKPPSPGRSACNRCSRRLGKRWASMMSRTLLITDSPAPGVWTYLRHIVMSKGLIDQMDEDELAGNHGPRASPLVARRSPGHAIRVGLHVSSCGAHQPL